MAWSMNPFQDRLTKPHYPKKLTNTLHKFASYNCLFTLSGLTEAEIRKPKLYLDGKEGYNALYSITEGDYITIYNADNEIIYEGDIIQDKFSNIFFKQINRYSLLKLFHVV